MVTFYFKLFRGKKNSILFADVKFRFNIWNNFVIVLTRTSQEVPSIEQCGAILYHSPIRWCSVFGPFQYTYLLITRWNDKIVVLKKTTLQLYFKTFIEKINLANLIM